MCLWETNSVYTLTTVGSVRWSIAKLCPARIFRHLIATTSSLFFRRHLIEWGDWANLPYGHSLEDSPNLWSYMSKDYQWPLSSIAWTIINTNCWKIMNSISLIAFTTTAMFVLFTINTFRLETIGKPYELESGVVTIFFRNRKDITS